MLIRISLSMKMFSCFHDTTRFSFFNLEERDYQEGEKVKDTKGVPTSMGYGYGYREQKQSKVQGKTAKQSRNILPFLGKVDDTAVGILVFPYFMYL